MGRLIEKLKTKEPITGSIDSIGGIPMADIFGEVGLDYAVLDTMLCAFDWSQAQAWGRAALLRGLDPFVRLPSYPWLDAGDPHAFAETIRAFGIGLNGVCVSINTAREVAEHIEISNSWHKNVHLHPFSRETFAQYEAENAGENMIMPLVESESSIRAIDKILAVDGLQIVWLGLTDVSRMLDVPFDYDNQKVWDFVDRAVEVADKYNVAICCNPGYEFCRELETLHERMANLRAHGVRGIQLQNSGFLVQWFYRRVINNIPDYVVTEKA